MSVIDVDPTSFLQHYPTLGLHRPKVWPISVVDFGPTSHAMFSAWRINAVITLNANNNNNHEKSHICATSSLRCDMNETLLKTTQNHPNDSLAPSHRPYMPSSVCPSVRPSLPHSLTHCVQWNNGTLVKGTAIQSYLPQNTSCSSHNPLSWQ